MSNLLTNMRDLQFVFFEQLDIEKLFKSEKHSAFSKEDVIMMLKEAEKLAVNVLLPLYPVGDREGCTFQDGKVSVPKSFHDAYRRYVEGGWLCPSRAPEVGGQGMPAVVSTACIGLMQAANYPLVMYPNLTNGGAFFFVRLPASRAMDLISTVPSKISGTSSSNRRLTRPGCVRLMSTCGPRVLLRTSTT